MILFIVGVTYIKKKDKKKDNSKKIKVLRILNIVEAVSFLVMEMCFLYLSFSSLNSIASGVETTARVLQWYDILIKVIWYVLFFGIPIFEIFMLFVIKKKYILYTFIYLIIEIIISFSIWWYISIIGIFISFFIFNLAKCIYRTVKMKEILK